jgi:iron complex outermembrane receptor protein
MRKIRNLAFAGVSLLTLASPAWAEEVATTASGDSDSAEIIVSARRRDEIAQDVPIVINAVTAETIEKLNLRKFEDIQSVVPGLSMRNNANGIGTVSSVRGVNFDVNVSGNSGTIEYYFNDASISSGILFNAMFDIGQIEVLRGPQGTLRGRASPSGSITIATRRPDLDSFGGYIDATANDLDGQNLKAALNVPVWKDKLAVRVSGLIDWNQSNRVRSLNSQLSPLDRTKSGRISLRAEPFDFLSLSGTYQHVDRYTQTFGQVESFANIVPGTPDGVVHINPADRLGTSKSPTTNQQVFDIWNWQAQLRYAGQRLVYVGSYTTQDLLSIGADADGAVIFPAISVTGRTKTGSSARSHEIRLQNDDRIAGLFDYVVGYF